MLRRAVTSLHRRTALLAAGRRGDAAPPRAPAEEEYQPPKRPEAPPRFLRVSTPEGSSGVVTVALKRAPVNSLSLEALEELNAWLLWLGVDASTQGVVLTSDIPKVFSAGLDVSELLVKMPPPSGPDAQLPERLMRFWGAFQQNWLILNSFTKPIVAGISGNCPGAGCILALGCDSRVMARGPAGLPEGTPAQAAKYRIGLNETKLGVVAPPWVMSAYKNVLGQRRAERMLQLGETPTAEEALSIGLVDVVVDEEGLMEAAHKEVAKFMSVPNQSRWTTRDMMRQDTTMQFLGSEEEREYDAQFFATLISGEEVQANIAKYLERLSGKGKKQ